MESDLSSQRGDEGRARRRRLALRAYVADLKRLLACGEGGHSLCARRRGALAAAPPPVDLSPLEAAVAAFAKAAPPPPPSY